MADDWVTIPETEWETIPDTDWETIKPEPINPFIALRAESYRVEDINENIKGEFVDRNKIQLLLEQTLPPEEARRSAGVLASSHFDDLVTQVKRPLGETTPELQLKSDFRVIRQLRVPEVQKEEATRKRTKQYLLERMDEIQQTIQAPYEQERWERHQKEYKDKFLKKTYLRWERGAAMVAGGGLHLAEEMERLFTGGKYGETHGELARLYHDALNIPEMQPVIEHAFDKYLGGAIETAPFIMAAMPTAIATGGATIPSTIGSFLVSYGVEGNMAYQTALDRGASEKEARIRGVIVGLINGGIEVAGGGAGKYFKQRAVTATMTKLGRVKYFTRSVLRNALREGLREEVPQELVQMIIGGDVPRLADGSVDWNQAVDRLTDTAIMGTIIGGLMDAPVSMYTAARIPNFEKRAYHSDVYKNIVKAHNETGGSTTNMETGKPVTEGFAVAIPESVEQVIDSDKLTEKQVRAYKEKYATILAKDKNRTVGTWVENGKSVLDISIVLKDKQEALEIARESKQRAIFDLKTFEDIPTVAEPAPVTEPTKRELQDQLLDVRMRVAEVRRAEGSKSEAYIALKKQEEALDAALAKKTRAEVRYEKAPVKPTPIAEVEKPSKEQYDLGHKIPKMLKMSERQRKNFMRKITGKRSMAKMTPAEAQKYIDALYERAGERGIRVGDILKKREFKEPTITAKLTPQLYEAEILGVKFTIDPLIIGKQKMDLEFGKIGRQLGKMKKLINKLGGETAASRAKAKLLNKPTKSVKRFAELINKYEDPPANLSKEETDIFNYFRTLSQAFLMRQNQELVKLGREPITEKKGYMRHIVDTLAQDMIDERYPIPEELKYWAEKNVKAKIRNPMEFQRKLGDELIEIFSDDLIKATQAMVWTGLKVVHLSDPLVQFEAQLGLYSEDIPASTRNWLEGFVNTVIKGQQTQGDKELDSLVTKTGLKGLINKVLRPFGRKVSHRPLTNILRKTGRLQIYGVMGWRPKQLIRNKFQLLQNLALYTIQANIKSYLPATKKLKGLLSESLFLESYKGFEDLKDIDKRTLGRLWLAPFQWTAISNARQAMKCAYYDVLELIEDPKYKNFGWADPKRTYKEESELLYPSEKAKILEEMEFGAGVTQYHYIPMAMPEVFRSKRNIPLTRLQSWWMNHFFKFHRESAHRLLKGETRYGAKLPWSRRVAWGRYMVIGGLVLNTLGYTSSFLLGAAPEATPPAFQLLLNLYKYIISSNDKARASAKRKFLNALKTFIPGYLAYKDVNAIWTGKTRLHRLFFYKKGIFAEEKKRGKGLF